LPKVRQEKSSPMSKRWCEKDVGTKGGITLGSPKVRTRGTPEREES